MNSKWKIHRVGLVDFWYYDEEEFYFSDGRMLLRGANGSGKSVTMQSLIPLLLDGNMRPERLDSFGSRARKMENYLLEEEDGREERTGYLYMELKREESEEYATFGIGLRARRNKSPESWYFHIHDGRRVGKDLYLYKELDEKIALTKIELRNKIGEGGRVMEEQREYMNLVNKTLFGFENEEEYKELIELLIRLRAPKLSKDLKPTVVSEILRNSLRPLSEDDLKPMSDAIEKMDETKLNLENLEVSLRSAKQIEKVYREYNEIVLFDKAGYFIKAVKEDEELKKEEGNTGKEIEGLRKEITDTKEKIETLDREGRLLEEEKKSLADGDVIKLKEEEEALERRVKEERDYLGAKKKTEEEKAGREKEHRYLLKEEEEKAELIFGKVESLLCEMEEEMENCPFDEFYFMKDEFLKEKDKEYHFDLHEKNFEEYRGRVKEAGKVLEEERLQNERYDGALSILDEYREKQDLIEKEERQCEILFHEEKQRLIEEVYRWEKKNEELHPEPSVLQETVREIENYDVGKNYFDIKNVAKGDYDKAFEKISGEMGLCLSLIEQGEEKIGEKERELAEWEAKKEAEPERSPAVIKNREKLKEEGIEFLNFYRVIDFEKGLPEEEKNRLEEALYEMGILDALIVSASDRERVLSLDPGLSDRYIFDDVERVGDSLLEKFTVDPEYNDILSNHKITSVLSGIGRKNERETSTWVGEKGEFGIGITEGKGSGEYRASFIGAISRERYKRERIEEIEKELLGIREEVLRKKEEERRLLSGREKLEEEWKAFPDLKHLDLALNELKGRRESLSRLREDVRKKKEEVEKEYEKLKELRQKSVELCAKCFVKPGLEEVRELIVVLENYKEALGRLKNHHTEYLATLRLRKIREEALREIMEDLDTVRYEIILSGRKLKETEERLASVKEGLRLTDYEKVKERLDFLVERLGKLPSEKNKCIGELGRMEEREDTLQRILATFEGRLLKSEKRREELRCAFENEIKLELLPYEKKEGEDAESLAERLKKELSEEIGKKKQSDLLSNLQEAFHKYRGSLIQYNITMNPVFEEETDSGLEISVRRLIILAKYKGATVKFATLVRSLEEEVTELESLLRESDREIYEDILIGTVGRKIRAKIYAAERWITKIKGLMESMETSSGLSLSLHWKRKTAEKEEELGTGALIEILMKDAEILRPEDSSALSEHFRSKIIAARKEMEDSGGTKSFYAVIKEVLDYRKWFEFVLLYRRMGEKKKELTDRVFFTFSGGEKAMAMYVPLFSAVVAKYDGARFDAPRLIALDEAFAGVDEMNIRDMFRLMSEFQFNFVINSQSLWGDYDTVPALAIYQLVRPENAKYVTVIRYTWNGTKRELVTKEGMEEVG